MSVVISDEILQTTRMSKDELLREIAIMLFYGSIVIPQAVAQEIAAVAARLTDAPGILTVDPH
jgi:predicted HTH domain antitoxin